MDYNHSTPKNAHQTSSSCYLRTINNEMDNELKNEKVNMVTYKVDGSTDYTDPEREKGGSSKKLCK